VTDSQLRIWAREQFPMIRGLRHTQVCSNRRKWIASVRYLGKRWLVLQMQPKARKVKPLRVVGA
jgi:hypothetical protein